MDEYDYWARHRATGEWFPIPAPDHRPWWSHPLARIVFLVLGLLLLIHGGFFQ